MDIRTYDVFYIGGGSHATRHMYLDEPQTLKEIWTKRPVVNASW